MTAAQQQLAEGEEIMVNTPYDVFTLPLQPSGLSSGPRFVVHVPSPSALVGLVAKWRKESESLDIHPAGLAARLVCAVELERALGAQQPAAVDGLAARLVDELDGLVSESCGVSGLHLNGDVATWDELLPGGRFERLSSLDELRAALAAKQQGGAA